MNSHNGSRSTDPLRLWSFTRLKLTRSEFGGTMALASTSLGEASARIQATDLERRKTPRVRTAPPGLRVEPKWLPALHFLQARIRRAVPKLCREGCGDRLICRVRLV